MSMWNRFIWIGLLSASLSGLAATKICVRSYPNEDASSPCVRFPKSYVTVVPWSGEDGEGICTRSYGESYCEISSKEYRRVKTTGGETICTLHYEQPPVSNLCQTLPQFYTWAEGE